MTNRNTVVRRARTAPELNPTVALVAGAVALLILAIIIAAALVA